MGAGSIASCRVARSATSAWGAAPIVVLVLAALLLPAMWAAQNAAAPRRLSQGAFATHRSAALPAAARGVVARTLGSEDRRYFVRRTASGLALADAAAGISVRFAPDAAIVRTAGGSWPLSLGAIGRGDRLVRLAAARPTAHGNRVSYLHPGLEEWYADGPLGLEQGFTLASRPPGSPDVPLTLALGELPGGVTAAVAGDRRGMSLAQAGRTVLRYSGLFAQDARGRALPAWIARSGRRVSLRVDDRGARYPVRVDPFVQAGKLTASDGATSDNLGLSVAVSGDTIVVGAPLATVAGTHFEGAAYVFVRPAGGWASATQVAKLTPSDGANDSEFGSGVAISGDTIAVGAPELGGGIANGAVYVFVKPVAGWTDATETAKLTASDGHDQDGLGAPLAMTADTIAAANGRGAVYVFAKPGGGWANSVQTAKLTDSDSAAVGSVAIDAGTIAAGAPNVSVGGHLTQGAVYVFTEPNTGWVDATQTAKLTASDGAAGDNLGASVGVSGGVVAAGARYAATPSTKQGAVYVFVRPAGGWVDGSESAKLTASDGAANDTLGSSVMISGDTIVAGAPQPPPSSGNGAVYVFTKPAAGWHNATQSDKLTASDGASGDQFGYAVGITPDTFVAGAPHATVGGNQSQGAAYVYAQAGGTATFVSCVPTSVMVGSATACTATVSNSVAGGADPTGSVTFSTDSSGSFASSGVCMLSSTGTAGAATCTADYTPSSAGTGTHMITAGYGGDGSHAASTGATHVTVTSSSGGGGGGGSGEGGGSGGGGGIVVARFGVFGRAKTLVHALLLNGGASTTSTGGIADYTWIVGSPGSAPVVDPCGPTPLAAISFQRAGINDVTLRVTTTSGQTAQVTQRLNVPAVAASQWFQAAYDCENPGAGNVPNRADCVKTFGWGVVQVNSRGNPGDCFQLKARDELRQLSAADQARQAAVSPNIAHVWATHATIKGPIAIDGLYMPVPESVQSNFDDWDSTIQIGQPIPIAVGTYRLASVVLNTVVGDPDPHTGLVPLKANVGLTGNNQSIGALPLAGTVDVNLSTATTADGFNISKVKLHVKLPSPFSTPVDGFLESDNETGAHITGFQVGPFDTDLLPGFSLKNAFFRYVGGTDQVWTGGANIGLSVDANTDLPTGPDTGLGLPGINFSPPPPDLGIGFRHGSLDHFGIGVNFPPALQPPLFPGVTLSNAHFAFGLSPLRFTGGLGIAIGQLIAADGDGFVAFASPSTPYTFPNDVATGDLSPLAGRYLDTFTIAVGGDFHLMIPAAGDIPLLNAWLIYEAPDYFEVGSHFDFKVTLLELKGDAGGWVLPSQGKFSLGGDLSLCMNVHVLGFDIGSPCLGNGVVVSSRGFGGCATVLVPSPVPLVPAVPVTIAAGYTWDGTFEVKPFSCDLGDFTEANPRGAVDRAHPAVRASQAGSGFSLRAGTPSAVVNITGQGGAPAVTLAGPGGRTYSTANPPTDPRRVLIIQYGDTTLMAVNHPAGGRWTVSPNAGSVPVASIAYATGLPSPDIKAKVSGHGRSLTLAYRFTPAPGRAITFVEQGPRTYHIVGAAHGDRGRIRFSPAPGRAGRRTIVAEVTDHGVHSQSLIVARYAAPGPQRPVRPRRVRVRHHGFTLDVTWTPVAGAAIYEVLVEPADGGRETAIVRDHRARVVGIDPGLRGKVLVNAVTFEGMRGPKGAGAFTKAPVPMPKRPKLRRPKPRRHHR